MKLRTLLLTGLTSAVLGIHPALARLDVFGSFETEEELSAVQASSGVLITSSELFPAWGPKSLRAIFPSRGGRIHTTAVPSDWRGQEALMVFVWSEQAADLTLEVWDSAGGSGARVFPVRPGVNHLQWRLDQISGVNLRSVSSISLSSGRDTTIYLDYLALDRFHPVLEKLGRWDVEYSLEIETPHVPWGRPLSGGPIKVYALSGVRDGRGIVELAQRLDLDFRVASIGRSPGINKWGFGDFYQHRSPGGEFWSSAFSLAHAYIAHDLLFGPPCDVIIWPGIHPWESYPEAIRNEIVRRVRGGTGLLLIDPLSESEGRDGLSGVAPLVRASRNGEEVDRSTWRLTGDHYITQGVAWEAFPWGQIGVLPARLSGESLIETGAGNPVLAVGKLGQGRVVALAYQQQGLIPQMSNIWDENLTYPYHEYFWQLLSRAVMWASKRDSASGIRSVTGDSGELMVDLREPSEGAALRVRVVDEFGQERQTVELPVSGDRTSVDLRGKLEGGRHFVDLRLLRGGQSLDWASFTLERPAPVRITSIESQSDRCRVGEAFPFTVNLSAAGVVECSLTARMVDNYGRLLDEKTVSLQVDGQASSDFSLNSVGALTHQGRVEVRVASEGVQSDRRQKDLFILQPRRWDDYDVTMYRFGIDPMPGVWPTIDRQLKRLNVTTLAAYSLGHSRQANYGIQAQTRISGQESPDGAARDYYLAMKAKYVETGDKMYLVREHCLNDPAYWDLVREELARMLPPWVPFSPTSYYVYEEPSLTCYGDSVDICFSSHCMSRMRDWLRESYRTLDALNRQWGTPFTRWEEVIPDDYREARQRGNYSSWADHRTFMEVTYAEAFRKVLLELRRYDPEGILLNSGTQISGPHNGCDYSRINPYTQHLNAYSGGNQFDFHRCFNADLKLCGGAGYGVLGKDVLFNFYQNLFDGANAGAYIFWEYSTLNPDLRLCQSGLDMEQGFREMRGEGIGKLVGLGSPDNHGIAIHYSYPSTHASWIVDGEVKKEVSYRSSQTFNRFENNRDGWVKILRDSGLQFDFIAYSDIESGGLVSKGYRVLVLPMSLALSEAEVQAISQFVQGGGILIADALPGIFDGHCRYRQERPLLDVFGVHAGPVDRETVVAMEGDPTLVPLEARSLVEGQEETRMLYHQFGVGAAFLLNYFLDGYPEARSEGTNLDELGRFSRVLASAGIRPKVSLLSSDGESVRDCATYLMNNGSTRLFGLIPDRNLPEKRVVRLQAGELPAAVYDVRGHEFLGFVGDWSESEEFSQQQAEQGDLEVELEAANPELLALVSGPINGIALNAPRTSRKGQEVEVTFQVDGPTDLRSVVKFEVFGPGGMKREFYSGNWDIVDGTGRAAFRFALDDPSGDWELRATEVISGVVGRATVRLP